jgi:hypothetical protein
MTELSACATLVNPLGLGLRRDDGMELRSHGLSSQGEEKTKDSARDQRSSRPDAGAEHEKWHTNSRVATRGNCAASVG